MKFLDTSQMLQADTEARGHAWWRRRIPQDLAALYQSCGAGTQWHIRVRWKLCPFETIGRHTPSCGKVVDIGCGHGLLANMLALECASTRQVIGIDPSLFKVEQAKRTVGRRRNISFETRRFDELDCGPFAAITIVDVLYLIPYAEQEALLAQCYERLASQGKLTIKTMDRKPVWKYRWNLIQETIAVKVLGITLGHQFHFRSRTQWATLLSRIGFSVASERLDQGFVHPHLLLICSK